MDLLIAISTTNFQMNAMVQKDRGLWAECQAPEISGSLWMLVNQRLNNSNYTVFFYLPLYLAILYHAYQQGHLTLLEATSLHKQVF